MASVADSVPDAVAPPPRHPRFPLVDGMRAIAVLGVLVVHAAVAGDAVSSSIGGRLLAHLNVGVTIFFLISGFLLYRPFIAHRLGGASSRRGWGTTSSAGSSASSPRTGSFSAFSSSSRGSRR